MVWAGYVSVGQSMSLVLLSSVCDQMGTLAFQTSYQGIAESRIPEPLAQIQELRQEEKEEKET